LMSYEAHYKLDLKWLTQTMPLTIHNVKSVKKKAAKRALFEEVTRPA